MGVPPTNNSADTIEPSESTCAATCSVWFGPTDSKVGSISYSMCMSYDLRIRINKKSAKLHAKVIIFHSVPYFSIALSSPSPINSHPGDLFPKNNLVGPGHTREDTMVLACRLRSSVRLRRSPKGRMVCIVARCSMRTGCALCTCDGVSATAVPQESSLNKKKKD
jgi:hypothetical protein